MYMQHIPGGTLQGVVRRVRETPPAERTGKLLLEAIDQTLMRAAIRPRPIRDYVAAWPRKAGRKSSAGSEHAWPKRSITLISVACCIAT